jgi:hypothetical protein
MARDGATWAGRFFGIVIRPRTYLEALYLLLAFPLGLAYFVVLTTGLLLGVGLLVILIGILVFIVTLALARALGRFERAMAVRWLGRPIAVAPSTQPAPGAPVQEQVRALVTDPFTWRAVVYLLLKLPLGIGAFVVVVSLIAISMALVLAPLYYGLPWATVGVSGLWVVDTLPEALVLTLIGIPALITSLHVIRWGASLLGRFAQVMLRQVPRSERLGPRPG